MRIQAVTWTYGILPISHQIGRMRLTRPAEFGTYYRRDVLFGTGQQLAFFVNGELRKQNSPVLFPNDSYFCCF